MHIDIAKLTTSNKYVQGFTVTGSGAFPFDMLRYDACFPVYEGEARSMGHGGVRSIRLTHTDERRDWEPTEGRWQSFGWSVQ